MNAKALYYCIDATLTNESLSSKRVSVYWHPIVYNYSRLETEILQLTAFISQTESLLIPSLLSTVNTVCCRHDKH